MTNLSFKNDGFNVIGHLSTTSGLGNTARLFMEMLQDQGIQVAGFDIDYNGQFEPPVVHGVPVFTSISSLPYRHNLIVVSIQLLPSLWLHRCPDLLHQKFKNVGLLFWELPLVPRAWWPALALFDAILTSSPFVRQAIELAVPDVPVLFAEHPLKNLPDVDSMTRVRDELKIPIDAFVCATSFDLRSDLSRKNPEATIQAFQQAFPSDQDVRLMIKTNGRAGSDPPANLRKLMAAIDADSRMVLVQDTLPYDKVLALYAAADVYMSLHRSEGLGLGPMEAMQLGRLVIATGFSGNMAYMTEVNSIPIGYRLIQPVKAGWQFSSNFAGKHAFWAQANIQHAALSLRWAKNNPQLGSALAQRGQRDVQEKQVIAWRAPYLETLMHLLCNSERTVSRRKLKFKVQMHEVTSPTLFRLNLKALISKWAPAK